MAASVPGPCTHVNRGRGGFCGAWSGVGCGRTVRAFSVFLQGLGVRTAAISRPFTHVNRGCGGFCGAWSGVGCGRTVGAFSIDLYNFCARAATVSATPTINTYSCGRRSGGVPCCASLSRRRLCEWTVCACLVSLCNGRPRTAFEFVGIARYGWWR